MKAQSTTKCFPNCDGVLVASFTKTENLNNAEYVAPKLFEQYNNYKQFVQFPAKIKSIYDLFQCDRMFKNIFFRF